ncbi:MAG: Ldh family oxidoreductase [Chloroflexi bacterium]|nr:Ldh family oxidoreductase [Chloroflexota bacterium]MCL5107829.1 Ldh family oxidoreductase [Chloroflexota bacterium]
MLQFKAEQLEKVASAIFQGTGTPQDVAELVAHSLVSANLMGHDSHGVLRIPRYCQQIAEGQIVPTARPQVTTETPTTAIVDGNWNFGQVTAKLGAETAIKKAKEQNVAVVTLVHQNHVGRLGEWSGMMAEAGMVGMVITGGWRSPITGVTPFGGAGRIIGTNPYSFAIPTGQHEMVLVDFATSVVAEGKLQVAIAKGAPVPQGYILDKDGNPSTDPNDFYKGGMLLPAAGHKGYSLALIADILGGLLAGNERVGRDWNLTGTFMLAVNVEAFRPLAEFAAAVDGRLDEIKAVQPAAGFQEVLIPGEPEMRSKAQREKDGIGVPEATWEALLATGAKYGVDVSKVAGI